MNTSTAGKTTRKSAELNEQIQKLIPGGVNSPFRSFHEVGGQALFIERGQGSKVFDVDGNVYIDYVGAWGPAILGHGYAPISAAVSNAIKDGALFGAPHKLELELAKALTSTIPSIEMVRFVNSGTEAVMSSIRLARGYTGKDLIVMFEGCYHGHSDSVLASSSHRHSSGIPEEAASNTIRTPFNDLQALDRCLDKYDGKVAAVILEPVPGSMGVVVPEEGFLQGLRDLCTKYGVVLIFDEVLTGFRVAYGGAQALYGVRPDLTCFGKALGGGMPIGAYGGKREIMEHLMPLGKVYQAGTFSGNPLTMAGALTILTALQKPDVYTLLEKRSQQLFDGMQQVIDEKRHSSSAIQLARVGSMFAIIFADQPVRNYKDSQKIDEKAFARFFHKMLEHGVMLPPTAVDAACVSAAHTEEDIEQTIAAFRAAMPQID